jgi:hypothetical protein
VNAPHRTPSPRSDPDSPASFTTSSRTI